MQNNARYENNAVKNILAMKLQLVTKMWHAAIAVWKLPMWSNLALHYNFDLQVAVKVLAKRVVLVM